MAVRLLLLRWRRGRRCGVAPLVWHVVLVVVRRHGRRRVVLVVRVHHGRRRQVVPVLVRRRRHGERKLMVKRVRVVLWRRVVLLVRAVAAAPSFPASSAGAGSPLPPTAATAAAAPAATPVAATAAPAVTPVIHPLSFKLQLLPLHIVVVIEELVRVVAGIVGVEAPTISPVHGSSLF